MAASSRFTFTADKALMRSRTMKGKTLKGITITRPGREKKTDSSPFVQGRSCSRRPRLCMNRIRQLRPIRREGRILRGVVDDAQGRGAVPDELLIRVDPPGDHLILILRRIA